LPVRCFPLSLQPTAVIVNWSSLHAYEPINRAWLSCPIIHR
jgi:hypothetical protein